MEILLLTVFLSLLLGVLFLVLYLRSSQQERFSSLEQEALRPFQKETPQTERKQ